MVTATSSIMSRCLADRTRSALVAGTVVGLLIDLLVTLLIPGHGIVEMIVAFISGLISGIGVSTRMMNRR